jgi:hypothetical protein
VADRRIACPDCGKLISRAAKACPECGWAPNRPSRLAAAVLAWTLGGFGAHKFYVGKTTEGVISLLLFWTFIPTIIAMLEGFAILSMSDQAFWTHYGCETRTDGIPEPPRPSMSKANAIRWSVTGFFLLMAFGWIATPELRIAAFVPLLVAIFISPPIWRWLTTDALGVKVRRLTSQSFQWVFGILFLLVSPLNIFFQPEKTAAVPAIMLLGFCLLPVPWAALYRRFDDKERVVRGARWGLAIVACLAGALLDRP